MLYQLYYATFHNGDGFLVQQLFFFIMGSENISFTTSYYPHQPWLSKILNTSLDSLREKFKRKDEFVERYKNLNSCNELEVISWGSIMESSPKFEYMQDMQRKPKELFSYLWKTCIRNDFLYTCKDRKTYIVQVYNNKDHKKDGKCFIKDKIRGQLISL